jgi:hypothetical protein
MKSFLDKNNIFKTFQIALLTPSAKGRGRKVAARGLVKNKCNNKKVYHKVNSRFN